MALDRWSLSIGTLAASTALLVRVAGPSYQAQPLRVPAYTAYLADDSDGAQLSRAHGISNPHAHQMIHWFGRFGQPGTVQLAVALTIPAGDSLMVRLRVDAPEDSSGGSDNHRARTYTILVHGRGTQVDVPVGEYLLAQPGLVDFGLDLVDPARPSTSDAPIPGVEIAALVLDGPVVASAHFNLQPRRNAASVHLRFPTDSGAPIIGFYTEVTAVTDPVSSYYMATGFARGYFGMQVNSPTERRIIFSVWDAAEGNSAKDRSTVAAENQVQLVAKGEGVEASVFGNEGTGGHSHLVYNWKTGSTQRFYVTAHPDGSSTVYSGYWFQPERRQWQLIASFRAPKDGGWLRSLYSFNEDFDDANGDRQRKALFGPQWIRLADSSWHELTTATFSTDATGKADRLDRYMGVEGDRFFLSNGGFLPGFTEYGARFTRPASGSPPDVRLP